MNNKVIYTAIIGGYDELIEPSFKPKGWDFICFSDRPLKSKTWKVLSANESAPSEVEIEENQS